MTQIRRAEAQDLARLVELEKLCFASPWGYKALAGELAEAQAEALPAESEATWPRLHVLVSDDKIVAYTSTVLVLDELQLYRIAVLPTHRRQGLAAKLMEEVWAEAAAVGAVVCTLEVRESNLGAIAFYERLGFHEVGRRKAYYNDTGEAAILMDRP